MRLVADPREGRTVAQLLGRMRESAFQGRRLGEAFARKPGLAPPIVPAVDLPPTSPSEKPTSDPEASPSAPWVSDSTMRRSSSQESIMRPAPADRRQRGSRAPA